MTKHVLMLSQLNGQDWVRPVSRTNLNKGMFLVEISRSQNAVWNFEKGDLNLWLKYFFCITYADDTSSSVKAKLLTDLIKMLEEDTKKCSKLQGFEWISYKCIKNCMNY